MRDREIEQPALGAQHGRDAERRGDGRGIQSCRHHYQAQVWPRGRLQPAQQRQRQISLEVPLVEFVQHHYVDSRERRIGDQTPRQDSFSYESQPSASARHFFEPDLIAHCLAEALAHLVGNSSRRHARGDAPGFEHQYLSAHQRQQRGRNARGFSRARRGLNHEIRM